MNGIISRQVTDVFEHHNYGISLMENGSFGHAVQELSTTLRLLKETMEAADRTVLQTCAGSQPTMWLDALVATQFGCSSSSNTTTALMNTDTPMNNNSHNEDQEEEDNQTKFYVVRQTLYLPMEMAAPIACTSSARHSTSSSIPTATLTSMFHELTSVILFNLALAHHRLAMEVPRRLQQEPQFFILQKAARLYELAYSTLQENVAVGDLLFPMVILNNLAVTHHGLGDSEAAESCFQQLLSLLLLRDESMMLFWMADDNTANHSKNAVSLLVHGLRRNALHSVALSIHAAVA
jgi:hypothetical protein